MAFTTEFVMGAGGTGWDETSFSVLDLSRNETRVLMSLPPPVDPLVVAVFVNVDTSASNAGTLTIRTSQTPLVSGINPIFHSVASSTDVQVQREHRAGTHHWWFTGGIYTTRAPGYPPPPHPRH